MTPRGGAIMATKYTGILLSLDIFENLVTMQTAIVKEMLKNSRAKPVLVSISDTALD
jgi:hypothetical protein